MRQTRRIGLTGWARGVLSALTVCLVGCEAPTDPRFPKDTAGVPQVFYLKHWSTRADPPAITLEAWGVWGVIYTKEREVTAETIWTSSDPSVARVTAPGRIQSVSPGEVTFTATLDRFTKTERLRVFPGEAPTRVLESASSTVRDSSLACCSNLLAGVTFEILTGHNAGRSAVSDTKGRFTFAGPFYCGESTIRMSKPGYREVVRPLTFCSEVPQANLELAPG
jgi:hypothetical protein